MKALTVGVVALALVAGGCGHSAKSNPDDLGLAQISESIFSECISNGEGPNGAGGHCDDSVTETRRLLRRIDGYHLSSADRKDLLTQAANDSEPYCEVCADMIDRVAK